VTLTEHFKKAFGITIMQYVQQRRMALAEQMLLGSNASINEIAVACGFADVEYFSRTFKNIHGISPNRWRRERKEENESE
jgi:AraC-like DNA-binding protein